MCNSVMWTCFSFPDLIKIFPEFISKIKLFWQSLEKFLARNLSSKYLNQIAVGFNAFLIESFLPSTEGSNAILFNKETSWTSYTSRCSYTKRYAGR